MLSTLKTICKNAETVNNMVKSNPILLDMSSLYLNSSSVNDYIDAINRFIEKIEQFDETALQVEYLVHQLNSINTEKLPINYAVDHLRKYFTHILESINNINDLKS